MTKFKSQILTEWAFEGQTKKTCFFHLIIAILYEHIKYFVKSPERAKSYLNLSICFVHKAHKVHSPKDFNMTISKSQTTLCVINDETSGLE